MRLTKLIAVAFTIFSGTAYGQTDSCHCALNLEDLIQKTETNYIAYHQKIKDKSEPARLYERFKKGLTQEALKSSQQECIKILKKYTSYFNDGHLFVFETPLYTKEELAGFQNAVQTHPLSETEAIQYFTKNKSRLDAIEGIWYGPNQGYKIAVIKKPGTAQTFIAVVLETKNALWKPGFIKASFTKKGTKYTSVYYTGNFTPAEYEIGIHKNAVMNIGPLIYFGKTYPVSREQAYLNKNDASLPTITKLDADHVLVSIPSFLVEYPYMDSLVKAHQKDITSAKNLLIDIRGNAGGNAVYFPLINLYYTKPHQDSHGLALSSPNTIRYFEASSARRTKQPGDTGLDVYARVAKDMKENPGKIVNGPAWKKDSNNIIFPLPQNVSILTDRACASAAESFIIHSKGYSDRVTTFGDNTYGMIDYTSTTGMSLLCPKQNYFFGYPTSTLHKRIPANGYNEKGIPPDVRIDDKETDKIQFILNWLKAKDSKKQ
jgi:hypothetical protein